MTTEQQAVDKFCPHYRSKCLGSLCMMWRWHHSETEVRDPKRPMAGAVIKIERTEHGFCGLVPADIVLIEGEKDDT